MPEVFGRFGEAWVSLFLMGLFVLAWRQRARTYYLLLSFAFATDALGAYGRTMQSLMLARVGQLGFWSLLAVSLVFVFIDAKSRLAQVTEVKKTGGGGDDG